MRVCQYFLNSIIILLRPFDVDYTIQTAILVALSIFISIEYTLPSPFIRFRKYPQQSDLPFKKGMPTQYLKEIAREYSVPQSLVCAGQRDMSIEWNSLYQARSFVGSLHMSTALFSYSTGDRY